MGCYRWEAGLAAGPYGAATPPSGSKRRALYGFMLLSNQMRAKGSLS